MLFLWIFCDNEKRIQLLQDANSCFYLAVELINTQWLSISYAYIKDALKIMTVSSVAELLDIVVEKLRSTAGCRQKYIQISALLLKFLFKRTLEPIDARCYYLTWEFLTRAMYHLEKEGEIKLIKEFIKSVNKD